MTALGSKVPLRFAQPMGTSRHYIDAVVQKVQAELRSLPARAPVAIHLSGHGLSTTMCGDYGCGSDAYHAFSRGFFKRTKVAIGQAIRRSGRFGVFSVYGGGSEGDQDPDNEVDSPVEALSKRAEEGFKYVIDVPFEFDSNSRDTLIVLRNAYRRRAPDWNSKYESRFVRNGMNVKLANAYGGIELKADALEEVARRALSGWLTTL